MLALGIRLCEARKALGMSIEDVEVRTKIKAAYLIAIEEGDFEKIPGQVYARAFLRSYARLVGLSTDDIVAEYEYYCTNTDENRQEMREQKRRQLRRQQVLAVTVVLVSVFAVIMYRLLSS